MISLPPNNRRKNKMIREWFAQFNKSLSERVVASRHKYELPIKLSFEPDRNTGRLQKPLENLFITGETKDLSHTGIAFVVPSIRLKENYLVGEGRALNAEIDLPNGKIKMQIVGQRYEQVGKHISTASYLVGAKILQMTAENRELYQDFLRHGRKRKAGSLKLGIDES